MFKDYFKADPDDFIIVVMGPTGSGKTNFVNHLIGKAKQQNEGGLKSDTQDVTPHRISYHDLRLVLVDTPGFDDTERQDSEILRAIADWLLQKYADGTTLKIAGIVYLHRITDNRMSGSVYKNLQMFGRLCGNIPLRRTRLVTTMWDSAKDKTMATQRETELMRDFWQQLVDEGAIARRFYNTTSSAWDVVEGLLIMGKDGNELLLQEELVTQKKRLNETEAGQILYTRLQKLLTEQKKMLKALADEAKLRDDSVSAKSLREEYDKINGQLQKTFEEMRAMKIPLSRRIVLWLSGRKSNSRAVRVDHPRI